MVLRDAKRSLSQSRVNCKSAVSLQSGSVIAVSDSDWQDCELLGLSSLSSCGVLLVQVPLLFSSISLQNPVKQQQARHDAIKYKAPAASPTSAAQRDQARFRSFRRSICIEKPRQPSGHLKQMRQKTGGTDSKSTGGASHSSASRAGNEGGLAAGARKKGAK